MSDQALSETVELLSTRAAAHRVGVDIRTLPKIAEEAGIAPFAAVSGLRSSRRKRRWATCAWEPEVVAHLAAYVRATRGGAR